MKVQYKLRWVVSIQEDYLEIGYLSGYAVEPVKEFGKFSKSPESSELVFYIVELHNARLV